MRYARVERVWSDQTERGAGEVCWFPQIDMQMVPIDGASHGLREPCVSVDVYLSSLPVSVMYVHSTLFRAYILARVSLFSPFLSHGVVCE